MSRLLVYAGPNGSGKSSLREALGETTHVVIDLDQTARRTVIFDDSGERHRRILEIDKGMLRPPQELPAWLAIILPTIEAKLS